MARRREEPLAALPRRGQGWGPARHQNCFVEAEDTAAGACAAAMSSSPAVASSRWACRACGVGEASVLLLPCRHLCMCKSASPASPRRRARCVCHALAAGSGAPRAPRPCRPAMASSRTTEEPGRPCAEPPPDLGSQAHRSGYPAKKRSPAGACAPAARGAAGGERDL
jgi:hypothetical protein